MIAVINSLRANLRAPSKETLALAVCFFACLISQTMAQTAAGAASSGAATGGNAGLLAAPIGFFTANVSGGLIQIGVLGIALYMMSLRFSIIFIMLFCSGAILLDNYLTAAGFL